MTILFWKWRKNSDRSTTESKVYSICNDALMYCKRAVLPLSPQKQILRELHTGDPRISRMKSLMRSYVYWHSMDRDIESLIKTCKGCALAAKAPPIKFNPWPETDCPWSHLHIDLAGSLNGSYYLIVVVSFSKWPEILRCKKPTTRIVIGFLHELFMRFRAPDSTISDNTTQFTSKEFKRFCKMVMVEHIIIAPYHPRSNSQVEQFVDTFKRALKKSNGGSTETALQQFLQVYWLTPNKNEPLAMTLTEIMLARKIRSVFDKMISKRKKSNKKLKINFTKWV